VHRPTSTLSGASRENLAGHSAASIHTVTDSGVSEGTSDTLASTEHLSSRNGGSKDDDDDDNDEKKDDSNYDDDR